jgi:transcriptional regulator of acetoin/glycerol metabolism
MAATAAGTAPERPGQDDALSGFELGDPTLRQIVNRLRRLSGAPVGLVLQGESGSGKSALAQAVHLSGPRRDGPLRTLHCASLDADLLDDTLFGRPLERPPAPGLLRRARGGTLVLDEVADLPLPLQARLLRVLQDDMLAPLPGEPAQPLDVALICTSRRRLIDEVACGRLREDLYYRLNGLTLMLPPLRERSDLAALCRQLLDAVGSQAAVDPGLLERLTCYPWPGNGRQLANALRAASAQLEPHERMIRLDHLPDDLREELAQLARQPQGPDRNRVARPPLDAAQVARTVAACEGNLSEAARRLGISRNTLYRRLREAGEDAGEDDSASR